MTMRMMTGMGISPQAELVLPVSSTRDHCRGPDNAPVTLLEHGDYECPFLREGVFYNQEHRGLFWRSASLCFSQLSSYVHPHAQQAAEAAEAAGAQGKFLKMHDMPYENQDALDDPNLREYALAPELDMERFDTDMMTHVHAKRVREDFMSGVNGTPTFYLNGIRYYGPWDDGSLMVAIEELIAAEKKKKEH